MAEAQTKRPQTIKGNVKVTGYMQAVDSVITPYTKVDSMELAGVKLNEIIDGSSKLVTDTMVVGLSRFINYQHLNVVDSIVIFNNATNARLKKLYP